MWWMIAKAGLDGAMAYSGASVNRAVSDANNRVADAGAAASNRVRGAGNAFSAARGSLARYMQSVNNAQTLEAGGHALEANLINARRADDAMSSASFEDQIKSAEAVGAQAAAAAFAGVGGEVADSISLSTRLMQQRAAAEAGKQRDFATYDAARRAGVIQTQTIRSLDDSLILDSVDYSMDTARHTYSQNPWMAAIAGAGSSIIGNLGGLSGGNNAPSSWPRGRDTNDYGGGI